MINKIALLLGDYVENSLLKNYFDNVVLENLKRNEIENK